MLRQRPGERLLVLHSRGATRPDAQRAMLRRIGQFQGSLNSAQSRCTDASFDDWAALDTLGARVDRLLVQVDAASPPRYCLLESTRLCAQGLRAAPRDDTATVLRHRLIAAALPVSRKS